VPWGKSAVIREPSVCPAGCFQYVLMHAISSVVNSGVLLSSNAVEYGREKPGTMLVQAIPVTANTSSRDALSPP
jgi:hypothetical protein